MATVTIFAFSFDIKNIQYSVIQISEFVSFFEKETKIIF